MNKIWDNPRKLSNWRLKQRIIKYTNCDESDLMKPKPLNPGNPEPEGISSCRVGYNFLKTNTGEKLKPLPTIESIQRQLGPKSKGGKSKRFRKTKRSRKTRRKRR